MTNSPVRFETASLAMLQPDAEHQWRWSGNSADDRQLVQSIEQLGLIEPIVVEEDTYRIIKGHRRYAAAKAVGMASIPCALHPPLTNCEYEVLRFNLQATWKPLTKRQIQLSCRRLREHGIDVLDDMFVST